MDQDKLVESWLRSNSDDSAKRVEAVLVRHFGRAAVRYNANSHQFRVKYPALDGLPGFGIGGYLSVPVDHGQRVKNYYLRRIAQAIKHLKDEGSAIDEEETDE